MFKDVSKANGTVAVNTKATETISEGKIMIKSSFGKGNKNCKVSEKNLRLRFAWDNRISYVFTL